MIRAKRTSGISPQARPLTLSTGKVPQILLFGDSHSHAVQRAIEKRVRKGRTVPLTAHRLLKQKNGALIGDTKFEKFLDTICRLGPDDVVLSMIGGNQHAVFSTIQHPHAFDFFTPGDLSGPAQDAEIIPYQALADVFENGLRNGDGESLEALRRATPARVVHIISPPPKADNSYIEEHHESIFRKEGLASRGVSSPALRMKFWRLQTRILEQLCAGLGIEVMQPPSVTLDQAGFLRPEFYAKDATHANPSYGEWLLRDIEARFMPNQAASRGLQ